MPLLSFKRFWLLHLFFFFFCLISSSSSITLSILPENVTVFGDAVASFKNNTIVFSRQRNCTSPAAISSSSSAASSVSGVGRAFYMNPIRFLDPSTNAAASFLCKFSFSITLSRSCPYGDGFAFLITSNTSSVQPLGLQDSFLAVEFKRSFDPSFDHTTSNHVGINVKPLTSLVGIADVISRGVDLKGGNKLAAWIEYNDSRKMIAVWVSNSSEEQQLTGHRGVNFSLRPSRAVLVAQIDLSLQFKEFMHIGFSASNAQGSAVYTVEKWEFETFSFESSSSTTGHDLSGHHHHHHHHEHIWILGLLLVFGTLIAMIFIFTSLFLAGRHMY